MAEYKRPTSKQLADTQMYIKQLFEERDVKNLSDDITLNIARTISHLALNYPQRIKRGDVAGISVFTHNAVKQEFSLADIYINRILSNIKSVSIETSGTKGLYDHNTKQISFNINSINEQSKHWKSGAIEDQSIEEAILNNKTLLTNNLKDKVIVHEFAHASADDSFAGSSMHGGFQCHSFSKLYCSRLEEIMAEKIAIDTTGQKVVYKEVIKDKDDPSKLWVVPGYNPESSNFAMSSLIEFIPKALGEKEIVSGWLSNPTKYIENFNEKFKDKYPISFATVINNNLKQIVDERQFGRLCGMQTFFMEVYKDRIDNQLSKSNNIEDIKSAIYDAVSFQKMLVGQFDSVNKKVIELPNKQALVELCQSIKKWFDLAKTRDVSLQSIDFKDLEEGAKTKFVENQKEFAGLSKTINNIQKDNQEEQFKTVTITKDYSGTPKPPSENNAEVKIGQAMTQASSPTTSQIKTTQNSQEVKDRNVEEDFRNVFIFDTIKLIMGDINKYREVGVAFKDCDGNSYNVSQETFDAISSTFDLICSHDNRKMQYEGQSCSISDVVKDVFLNRKTAYIDQILQYSTIPEDAKKIFENLQVTMPMITVYEDLWTPFNNALNNDKMSLGWKLEELKNVANENNKDKYLQEMFGESYFHSREDVMWEFKRNVYRDTDFDTKNSWKKCALFSLSNAQHQMDTMTDDDVDTM